MPALPEPSPSSARPSFTVRPGLYAIVDLESLAARELDAVAFTRAVLFARPAFLQIRAKQLGARELLALLRAVAPLCRAASVPLVANDRVDLAALAGSILVHVGQTDLSPARVRRVAPGLGVGVSTHTREQLEEALVARPDYVAYGPVFPTGSKRDPDPCVGLEGLRVAAALAGAAGIPLVAIGGVTLERAPEIARVAPLAAAIHALLPDAGGSRYDEVTARAVALHEALGGALPLRPSLHA